jgi:diadenosine tetraphosphatase ApaH/serine/threonine PP2A family protein phosphatase
LPRNPEKARTVSQMTDEDYEVIRDLPNLAIFDDLKLIVVHAGLWPKKEWWRQPHNVIRAQMIRPPADKTRWWGPEAAQHKDGKSEDDSRKEGYERWYRLYDHEYDVVYGHSVFAQPNIQQNPGAGMTIGIDTGCCFGGALTAVIMDGSRKPYFISVKAKKIWFARTYRDLWGK